MTDWTQKAKEASAKTQTHFKESITKMTSLGDAEIEAIINDSGISSKDLTSVLDEVKNATKSNNQKAEAIKNINQGVDLLVGIISRLI